MRMRRVTFLLGFAALCQAGAAQSGISIASLASAKTSISVKNEPVGDVIKTLAKTARLPMEAGVPLRDLKVTIFANEQSSGLLLDKIADVLDCTWKVDAGNYYLVRTSDEQHTIDSFLDAEDKEWRADSEQEVAKLAAAANGTYSEFLQAMSSSNSQGSGSDGSDQGQPVVPRRRGPVHPPFLNRATTEAYAAGQMFRNSSDSDLSALWSGQVLQGSMPGPEHTGQTGPSPASLLFVRYDLYGNHQLEMVVPPQQSMERPYTVPGNLHPTPSLSTTKFGKEVEAWPNLSAAKDDLLSLPITREQVTGRPPVSEDGGEGPGAYGSAGRPEYTMADQLKQLFDKTGVTIVADGFLTAVGVNQRPVSGSDVKSFLDSLVKADGAYVKIADGVVMARHGGFWRLRQYEIPADALAPLAGKAHPTLSDYISFVSQLTVPQLESFRSSNAPLLGFPTDPIRNAMPALKFAAALPNIPASGVAVRYDEMDGGLRNLFVDVAKQALFWGGSWLGSGPGPEPQAYAFMLTASDVPGPLGLEAGTTFLFGSSRENAVQFEAVSRN